MKFHIDCIESSHKLLLNVMRLSIAFACLGLAAMILSGCSSVSDQESWHGAGQKNLCLVDNPSVRPQVFLTLRRALMDKGLKVRRVQADDTKTILSDCPQTLRYEAIYGSSWTHSTLRYAKLELTEVGRHNNVYSVQWDERTDRPTLLDSVEDASVELRELVDRLFPSEIPWR